MAKPDPKFILIEEILWREVGSVLADRVKERIRSAGGRWLKTGTLLNSITSIEKRDGQLVVATGARLQTDETAQMFADEILQSYLEPEVQRSIAQAVFNAFVPDGVK